MHLSYEGQLHIISLSLDFTSTDRSDTDTALIAYLPVALSVLIGSYSG